MSSILKALKKLENEKILRQPDALELGAEILRTDRPAHLTPFRLGLIAVLLFGCGGAVTYLRMKGEPLKPAAPPQPPLQVSAGKTLPLSRTLTVERIEPDVIVPALAGPDASDSASDRRSRRPSEPAGTADKSAGQPKTTPAVTAKAPANRAPEFRTQPVSGKRPAETRAAAAGQIPPLKVDGIAFQDGIDSVAMINNVPVSKGSLIEGVRVENIYRDRVQFMYGTEQFEIPLGRSNR